jgi:RHS repeat-associated protein
MGQARYYHYDGLGSTQLLTDENGNVTDSYCNTAFGESVDTGAANPTINPFQFVGQGGYYLDSDTGNYYVRARLFAPTLARWLSDDPAGHDRDSNLSRYCRNSPVTVIDPDGLGDPPITYPYPYPYPYRVLQPERFGAHSDWEIGIPRSFRLPPRPRPSIEAHPGEFQLLFGNLPAQDKSDLNLKGNCYSEVLLRYIVSAADKAKYAKIEMEVQVRTQRVRYGFSSDSETDSGWHVDSPKRPELLTTWPADVIGPHWIDTPGIKDNIGSPLGWFFGFCPSNGAEKSAHMEWVAKVTGTPKAGGQPQTIGYATWSQNCNWRYWCCGGVTYSGKTGEPIPEADCCTSAEIERKPASKGGADVFMPVLPSHP